jgi:predicted nucleic-acid-binding protein
MRAIDTNLLIRLLTRDDPDQAERAEQFIRTGAWISHVVLTEAIWVLGSVYGLETDRLALAVEMLLEHTQLVIQDPDVVAEALQLFKASRRCEFSDCLILATARRAGHLPLGTFDRALAHLEGATTV